MILQALVSHYEQLARKGEIVKPGWQTANVSYALHLDLDGTLLRIVSIKNEVEILGKNGKTKKLEVPQTLSVPEQDKRSSGVSAYFLCDNITYFLGYDVKGKADRTRNCFEACKGLHTRILEGLDSPQAQAIVRFFRTWRPDAAGQHPAVMEALEKYKDLSTANLIFEVNDAFVLQSASEIADAWEKSRTVFEDNSDQMRCLVTGREAVPARLHPVIKGVDGAQSMGLSMVSFNAPAFESFGRDGEQGNNAPVSEYAAFAYGAALNHLLADRDHRMVLGDMTVVFWAEDAESAYQDAMAALLSGFDEDTMGDNDVRSVLQALSAGKNASWNDIPLKPDNRFYILGIAPNAARATVRLFLQDSFGTLARHVMEHQGRMEIVRPAYDHYEELSLRQMLFETVNQNSQEKKPLPQMAGDVLKAILIGGRYPAALYSQVQIRLRAGDKLTRGKAAIIKAYLIQNMPQYKEVLQVKLNEETNYAPYVLGRLFAVLESLQKAANPGINTTIRDRFFNAASCTPAVVFPPLIRLSQAHTKKLDAGLSVYYSRMVTGLEGMLTDEMPRRMNLYDQGIFQIGYYHQTQKLYEKKEEN